MSRRVVITGACGGIGQALVAAFHTAGWHVVGIDSREEQLPATCNEFVVADLGADGEVSRVFRHVSATGPIDALVNNAAVQINKSIADTTDDEWAHVMNVNVRASFQAIRGSISALTKSSGSIVNISSVHALSTSQNVAAYAISKGALTALTRTAAVELAPHGIRCNAVLPGAVDTPMLRDGLSRRPHPEGPDGNLAELSARTPLGFVATANQIAPTVVHLADNDLSPYTTGQTFVLDGGVLAQLGSE